MNNDPDEWIEDIARDAMRPVGEPEPEYLDIPAFIRHDNRITQEQINTAWNYISSRGEMPTGIEVVELNQAHHLRLEWGADVRLITQIEAGAKIEQPVCVELLGRK